MKKSILIALLLAGCATAPSNKVTLPDGSQAYMTKCNATGDCYRAASASCGGRYRLIEIKADGATQAGYGTGLYGVTGVGGTIMVQRSMIYRCED